MVLTPPREPFFKRPLADQPQDFFLIDIVILLCRKVDQLKEQIIDI